MEEKKFEVSRGTAFWIFTVLALLYFLCQADRFILIIALTPIKQAFHLSDMQAGLLTSLLTLGTAIIAIPAAFFGDRWARRKTIGIMAFVWSFFTLTTGLAAQFWHLVVSRFMVGSGEAGYAPVGATWLSVVFRKEVRARIMAIFYTCSQLGVVAGLVFGGLLISSTKDWRTPFYVFAVPGIILAVIAYFLPDYKSVKQKGESMLSKAFFKDWGQLFKIPSWWLITIGASLIYFLIFPLAVWVPTLLIRAYKMTPASAGATFGLLQLFVLLSPLAALLVDKWQKSFNGARPWTMAITSFLIAGLGLVAMLTLGISLATFLALLTLIPLLFAVYFPVLMAVGQDVVPLRLRATSQGVFLLIAQLTGATLGPIIAGAISDASGGGAQGIRLGILWMVPIAFLSFLASLLLLKFYHRDSAKVSDQVIAEK